MAAAIVAPGAAHPHSPSVSCGHPVTAKQGLGLATAVWNPKRWRRGDPKPAAIAAHRHQVQCAVGPGHRAAIRHQWKTKRRAYYRHRRQMRRCLTGSVVFSGRVSTFGPPGEGAGTTATGVSSALPGIAIYNQGTLGHLFRVTVDGHSAYLRQTDIGPAPWTGRTIDITGAGAALLGGVTTDHYGTAVMVPESCA